MSTVVWTIRLVWGASPCLCVAWAGECVSGICECVCVWCISGLVWCRVSCSLCSVAPFHCDGQASLCSPPLPVRAGKCMGTLPYVWLTWELSSLSISKAIERTLDWLLFFSSYFTAACCCLCIWSVCEETYNHCFAIIHSPYTLQAADVLECIFKFFSVSKVEMLFVLSLYCFNMLMCYTKMEGR